jgi:hypothetical protein
MTCGLTATPSTLDERGGTLVALVNEPFTSGDFRDDTLKSAYSL